MEGAWHVVRASTIGSTVKEILSTADCPAQISSLIDDSVDITEAARQVCVLTTTLIDEKSYCPTTWLERSEKLLILGYPELAAGDAFKAYLLLDELKAPGMSKLALSVTKRLARSCKNNRGGEPNVNKSQDQILDGKAMYDYWKTLEARLLLVLSQALLLCGSFVDCLEIIQDKIKDIKTEDIQEALRRIQIVAKEALRQEDNACAKDAYFTSLGHLEAQEQRRSGSIVPCAYPWMIPKFVDRPLTIIQPAQVTVQDQSEGKCILRLSSIHSHAQTDGIASSSNRVLGIFARRDISEDHILFTDRTAISGISDQKKTCCSNCRGHFESLSIKSTCCNSRFCTQECHDSAINIHHRPFCNQDKIQQSLLSKGSTLSAGKIASLDLLYRALAYAKNNTGLHPLKTPFLCQMTATYQAGIETHFSYEYDICAPTRILRELGVDIFKNHDFDTWVLQAIHARFANNTRGFEDLHGCYHEVANLSYIFLNHSCDANVYTEFADENGSNTLVIRAARDICKGEELFVSYISTEACDLEYSARQKLLEHWTGGECQCKRCLEEVNVMSNLQTTQPVPPNDGNTEINDDGHNDRIGEQDSNYDSEDSKDRDNTAQSTNRGVKRRANTKKERYVQDGFVVSDNRPIKRRKTGETFLDDEDEDFEVSDDTYESSGSAEDGEDEEDFSLSLESIDD